MLTLRPFGKKDLPLVAQWLYGEHAASWIDSPEDWFAELHDKDSAFTHIMAEVDGKPMGYCRYGPCGNGFIMGYLIGELEYIPPGYGRVMLDRMLALLRAQGATAVMVDPDDGKAINTDCRELLESCYFLWDGGFYTYFLNTTKP